MTTIGKIKEKVLAAKEQAELENSHRLEEAREEMVIRATGYFREGLNCAECVMKSYLDNGDTDFSMEILALTTGFGGGIGKTSNNTCGALVGACMAVGVTKGRRDPFAKETPKERIVELNEDIYPTFARMSNQFEKEFGSTICYEMCKGYVDHDGIERKRNCKKAIAVAAEIAANEIYR